MTWTVSHDFAFVAGGAERVTQAICSRVVPGAPLRVLAGSADTWRAVGFPADTRAVLPPVVGVRSFHALAPLMPAMLRRLPPIEGNLIASSYAFAHHLRCSGRKIVYCHSPMRQIWSGDDIYRSYPPLTRNALRLARPYLRAQDLKAASSADVYVATNKLVRDRVRQFYGRQDVVTVPPPIDVRAFRPVDRPTRDYYLWVGRIVEPYKRLDVAVEAFARLPDRRLLVVGDGPDASALRARAGANVEFLGWQSGEPLRQLYANARALVFTSADDFGMVPIEARACGTPTIAYRGGGPAETLSEGVTGCFYESPEPDQLADAVLRFEGSQWDPDLLRSSSLHYSLEAFAERMRTLLD